MTTASRVRWSTGAFRSIFQPHRLRAGNRGAAYLSPARGLGTSPGHHVLSALTQFPALLVSNRLQLHTQVLREGTPRQLFRTPAQPPRNPPAHPLASNPAPGLAKSS